MVDRFRPYYFDNVAVQGHPATMRQNTEGDWVRYTDYQALASERDKLQSEYEAGWKAFYELRALVARDKYPRLVGTVSATENGVPRDRTSS